MAMKPKQLRITQPGYYWCSVGGSPLEICEVSETSPGTGVWVAHTLGCPDPFFINMDDCSLQLYTAKPVDLDLAARGYLGYLPAPIPIPDLPEHMGGEKPLPRFSHGWRGPRQWS